MKGNFLIGIVLLILAVSCSHKNPPRDEIPKIKNILAKLEQTIKEKNAAAIDSLIIADSYSKGYSSQTIISRVYPSPEDTNFFSFGKREFFYTENKAVVNCSILRNSADSGRPAEITLTKIADRWLIEKFDLK